MEKLVRLTIRITQEQDEKIDEIVNNTKHYDKPVPKSEYIREVIENSFMSDSEKTDNVKIIEVDNKKDELYESDEKVVIINNNKVLETTKSLENKINDIDVKIDEVVTRIKNLNNTIDDVDDVVDDTKQVTCVYDKKVSDINKRIDNMADEVHEVKESLSDIVSTITSPKEYQDLQEIKHMLNEIKSSTDKM